MSLPSGLQPVQLLSDQYEWIREARIGSRIGNESRSKLKFSALNLTNVTGPVSQTFQISNESFMNSDLKMEVQYTFQVNGKKADGTPINLTVEAVKSAFTNNLGVSSFPYNRCINNCSIRLNNSSLHTTNVSDILDDFLYLENPDYLATLSPASKLDNFYKFDSNVLSNVLRVGADVIDQVDSRGLNSTYRMEFSAPPGGGVVTVTITLQESIIARPLQYHSKHKNPFFNINDLHMVINYESDITKFLNYSEEAQKASNYGVTDLSSVTFTGHTITNRLIIESYTPQIQIEKPRLCYYNSPIINKFKDKNSASISSGNQTTATFNNYVINGIPKLFILSVPVVQSTATGAVQLKNRGKAFARIDEVQFSFDNKVNQFTDLNTIEDLYDMSIKNGYNQRFATFAGLESQTVAATSGATPTPAVTNTGAGSIFVFRPEDLNMNSGQQSNVNGAFNIQLTLKYTNPHADALVFQPSLALVYDNILMYQDGRFMDFKPMLNPAEVVGAPIEMMNDDRTMNSIMGGSFWSDAWSTVKKVISNPITKEVSKFARNTPWLKDKLGDDTTVGKFLGKHGYGHGEEDHKGGRMYGRTHSKSNKGGSIMTIGGAKVSKKELLSML